MNNSDRDRIGNTPTCEDCGRADDNCICGDEPEIFCEPANYVDVGECCDDCIQAIANDDYSGMDDEQENLTRAGIESIGQWLIVGDEVGFSWMRCDVCGGLAGNRHKVGYIDNGGN